MRIRDLAHARHRFGDLRIWVLLRREGWLINRKHVRRLYRLDGVQLSMRVRRRKHIALHRGPWEQIYLEGAGGLGLCPRGEAGFYPTWEIRGECGD